MYEYLKKMKADLFCFELLLHQLRDHSVVIGLPWHRHIAIFHVFGLEIILHSCRGNDAQLFSLFHFILNKYKAALINSVVSTKEEIIV